MRRQFLHALGSGDMSGGVTDLPDNADQEGRL